MSITTVNIYRNRGEWCYAALDHAQHDHSDTIGGVTAEASETEAHDEIKKQFPDAIINRVPDTNIPNQADCSLAHGLTVRIPVDHREALEAIAALDAAKWGESEREASRRTHGRKSYGLLLNTLAHRPEYNFGDSVPHLVSAAQDALTADDWAWLRAGG